jgi:hypothetical protein
MWLAHLPVLRTVVKPVCRIDWSANHLDRGSVLCSSGILCQPNTASCKVTQSVKTSIVQRRRRRQYALSHDLGEGSLRSGHDLAAVMENETVWGQFLQKTFAFPARLHTFARAEKRRHRPTYRVAQISGLISLQADGRIAPSSQDR